MTFHARRSCLALSLLVVPVGLLWLGHVMRARAPRPESARAGAGTPAGRSWQVAAPVPSAPGEGMAGGLPLRVPAPRPFVTDNPELRVVADPSATLPARFDAASRLLAASLADAALKEVIGFLRSPLPADYFAAERERALRNGLLNQLREHGGHAPSLVPALVAMAADPSQDPGLRDYALQHLAAWMPALDAAERAQAIPALQAALRQPAATYAGTGLVGLHDLAARGLLPEPFDAVAEARRISLDERMSVFSRRTALALAAELGVRDDDLAILAKRWAEPRSPVPEGARRVAQNFLKLKSSLP
jgi:hypothetical protein